MKYFSKFNALRQRRPILAYAIASLALFCLLLVIVRVSITPVAQSGIIRWLKDHGVTATIDDLRLNVSAGKLILHGFDARDAEGHGAHVGTLEIDWQWDKLTENHLAVNRVQLDNFHIDVLLYPDGKMNVAGLKLPFAEDEAAQAVSDSVGAPDKSGEFKISLMNIQFRNINSCVKQYNMAQEKVLDYCASLGALAWNGDISYKLSNINSDDVPVAIKGALSLKNISVQNNALKRQLLGVDEIRLNDIQLDGIKSMQLNEFSINGFAALERLQQHEATNPHIVAFESLGINGIQLTDMARLTISGIELNNFSAFLQINKAGQFEFDEWMPVTALSDEDSKTIDNAAGEESKFSYAIEKFVYKSTRPVDFIDNHLKEVFSIEVPEINLQAGPLDSENPEQVTQIHMEAVTGRHASLKLDAGINPLANNPDIKGKINIAALDLRALSPLTRQYIGHSIRSGQLDSDITLKSDKGVLDSKIALTLNQFELRALNKQEALELNSELGFPLNASLSLLRDRDNNIRLEIPITGDVNNPDFDPADAIKKATSKAVTAAVLVYYSPFGLVLAADKMFDLATALKFEPLIFEAGQKNLNAKQMEQLDAISKMLIERPGVQLTMCGTSNKVDTAILFPDIVQAADKAGLKELPLNKDQRAALLQMAEKRGNSVKDYLVDSKNINSSRLIMCEPEYREGDAYSVVEIGI